MNITRSHVYCSLVVAGLGFAAFAGAGCATRAEFIVSALRADDVAPHKASYRLVPGPALLAQAGTPLADQLLRDVRTALSGHGYYEAPGGIGSEITVEVEFERSPPTRRIQRVSEPVYVSVSASPDAGRGESRGPAQPRKIGDRELVYWVTTYPKSLRLSAWRSVEMIDGAESTEQAWQVVVSHDGDSASPERDARWMVAAAMDWLGKSVEQRKTIVLKSDDPRLRFLEQGLPNRSLAAAHGAGHDASKKDAQATDAAVSCPESTARSHET